MDTGVRQDLQKGGEGRGGEKETYTSMLLA